MQGIHLYPDVTEDVEMFKYMDVTWPEFSVVSLNVRGLFTNKN